MSPFADTGGICAHPTSEYKWKAVEVLTTVVGGQRLPHSHHIFVQFWVIVDAVHALDLAVRLITESDFILFGIEAEFTLSGYRINRTGDREQQNKADNIYAILPHLSIRNKRN